MAHCNSKPKKMEKGGAAYGSNSKYSAAQRAKISELRTRLGMGDASQDEMAAMAKKLGIKGFKAGGPAAPVMPKEAKKRRENRRTRNDMTSVPKGMREYIEKMDSMEYGNSLSNADRQRLKNIMGSAKMAYGGSVKKFRAGGCVMSGRGGKFKGVS